MTDWSLRLLGNLELVAADAERPLRLGRKTGSLLLRVAVQGRLGVSREQLASLLWATQPGTSACNALRQCLHVLRRELGPAAGCIVRVDNRIVWCDELCPVDVQRFEWLARARDLHDLLAAARIYRGDLVDAFTVGPEFEHWLDAERERLRSIAHGLVAELSTRDLDPLSHPVVLDLGRRLLAADRLHEGACMSLMRLYAMAGLRSKVIEVYSQFAVTLRAELGLEPGARIAALASALTAPQGDPGLPSTWAPTVNDRWPGMEPGLALGRPRSGTANGRVDPRASDLKMCGWRQFTQYTAEGMAGAREAYAEAVDIDPSDTAALSMLGWTHWFDAISGWSVDPDGSLALADTLASRALACDEAEPMPHTLAGKVRLWQMRHAEALAHLERAVQLAHGGPWTQFHLGEALMWCGRPAESLRRTEQALRLEQTEHGVFLTIRGMASWMMGDAFGARTALESAVRRNPRYSWAHWVLSVLHHEAGDFLAARQEADLARRLNPRFTLPFARQGMPFLLPEHRARFERAWLGLDFVAGEPQASAPSATVPM